MRMDGTGTIESLLLSHLRKVREGCGWGRVIARKYSCDVNFEPGPSKGKHTQNQSNLRNTTQQLGKRWSVQERSVRREVQRKPRMGWLVGRAAHCLPNPSRISKMHVCTEIARSTLSWCNAILFTTALKMHGGTEHPSADNFYS